MANTRKRTSSGRSAGTKKQKTAKGANKSQPEVKIDEGFDESGETAYRELLLFADMSQPMSTCRSTMTAQSGMRR